MARSKSKAASIIMRSAVERLPIFGIFEDRKKDATEPAIVEELTPSQQLERFIKFASQCYIRSGTRLIQFSDLYRYQIELIRIILNYRGIVLVKDRQLGITEVLSCFMLDRSISNPAYASATFSIGQTDAHKVSNRVKRMPSRMEGYEWAIDSLGMRQPTNGGEMNFRPSTENGSRGLESIWDLFLDEAGFVRTNVISELYAASSPSQEMVGDYAKTFIVSTIPPAGEDCWFFERFRDNLPEEYTVDQILELARSGAYLNTTDGAPTTPIPGFVAIADESGWVHMAIGHKAHPIYGKDPDYVKNRQLKKKITAEQANREYNLTLPRSGTSLFDKTAIEFYGTGQWQHKPISWHNYLIGIDPNFGGNDYFVAQVWDVTQKPYKLAQQYRKNQASPTFSRERVIELAHIYKPVILAIESNSGGAIEAEELAKLLPRYRVETVNHSATSKRINTDRIALALERGEIVYPPDWGGISEMRQFSAATRQATIGHDDQVMAWAVAFTFIDEAVKLANTGTFIPGIQTKAIVNPYAR